MPRSRPQLSITLPRNFTFHYEEGEEPKTPEQESVLPPPCSPRAEGPYRIKRRSRPGAALLIQNHNQARLPTRCNFPLASVELPTADGPSRPLFQQARTEPLQTFPNLPRTPQPQQCLPRSRWNSQSDVGDSITRPLSVCSILSDSSDDSGGSLTSYPAGDGSCTSPESDAPDPFKFSSVKRGKGRRLAAFAKCHEVSLSALPPPKPHSRWTPEMDRHLWSTYLVYLQDPTVTPFKMLPGVAPPLGVCHRVSREAGKSWRNGVIMSPRFFPLQGQFPTEDASEARRRSCSPETIRGPTSSRSGSNTPTRILEPRSGSWPKSGSSTRRRLRLLCKRRPSIAPHYQRLLQSRSPSPFSPSARSQSRSQSCLSEAKSPLGPSKQFNTRDVHLSLIASTSDTMQPGGPLARLATNDATSQWQSTDEWFNEPPVPFASEITIPSDADNPVTPEDPLQTPRLGSPFGFHTWGPSRSKQRLRPDTIRYHSSDARHRASVLRSPLMIYDTISSSGVHKRRARHPLEDELSPGGSNVENDLYTDLFANSTENRHRRVRSRGFSLGDVTKQNPLTTSFTFPESADHAMPCDSISAASKRISPQPRTPTNLPVHLESPFQKLSPRPLQKRQLGSNSPGANDCIYFSSIGETLGRASCQASQDDASFQESSR